MEGSFSDQWVHQWLQVIADGAYASLHYDTPALADSTFAEIFGGGYVRQAVVWSQPTNRAIWSLAPTRWTGLSQNVITHYGLWDSVTGGTLIAYGRLPEKQLILSGHGFVIDAGELSVSVG